MRVSIFMPRWSAAPLCLALLACGGDGSSAPTEPPDSPPPTAVAMVSGDAQQGKAGEPLTDPLVVRVTTAGGEEVARVEVIWRVASGIGCVGHGIGDRSLSSYVSPTDADGLSRIVFEPTVLGTSTVVAEVDGLQGSPVTFTTEATVLVINLAPFSDCEPGDDPFFFGPGPAYSSDVTVPVGVPVEWVPACAAHIASTSEPAGGQPFDSGDLSPGERFAFVPGVAGTWTFEDRVHGATGSLTAR